MIRKKMAGAVLAAVVTASLILSGCGANIDPATTVATIGDTKDLRISGSECSRQIMMYITDSISETKCGTISLPPNPIRPWVRA